MAAWIQTIGAVAVVMFSSVAAAQEAQEPGESRQSPDAAGTSDPAGDEGAECIPSCRRGYVCASGQCVEACNPPCGNEGTCTDEGECEPEGIPYLSGSSAEEDWPTSSTTGEESQDSDGLERNSTGRMVGGIVLTGIGGVLAMSGASLLMVGDTKSCDDYVGCYGYDYRPAGAGILITGLALTLVGVPLICNGAKRVPKRYTGSTELRIVVTPTSGALQLRF